MRDKNRLDGFIGLVITVVIAIAIIAQMSPSTIAPAITAHDGVDDAATGAIVFSGNVSQNATVNFTIGTAVYSFAFNFSNASGLGRPHNYVQVNITNGENGTTTLSQNLSSAINNNATLAAILTATNGSARTIITYDTAGTAGNDVVLSDNSANIASSGLSGGSYVGYSTWSNQNLASYQAVPNMMSLAWWLIPLFLIVLLVRNF